MADVIDRDNIDEIEVELWKQTKVFNKTAIRISFIVQEKKKNGISWFRSNDKKWITIDST